MTSAVIPQPIIALGKRRNPEDYRPTACVFKKHRDHPAIVDIDEFDKNNELAQVEYVEEIYMLYKIKETEGCFPDYIDSQPDFSARMRACLIDWLIQVHDVFDLMPETLYLAINLVDRFLSVVAVDITDLQLVGITALLISSKYEEILPLLVDDMIAASNSAYSRDEILSVENAILTSLDWYLSVPTPYVFTVRYTKASLPSDYKQMEDMAFFFTDLALMDYSVTIRTNPSKLVASAVYAARCTLNKTPAWTETLKHYTGYSEYQLRDCAKRLVTQHACASENELNVYNKYANPDRSAVSLFPPATSL